MYAGMYMYMHEDEGNSNPHDLTYNSAAIQPSILCIKCFDLNGSTERQLNLIQRCACGVVIVEMQTARVAAVAKTEAAASAGAMKAGGWWPSPASESLHQQDTDIDRS